MMDRTRSAFLLAVFLLAGCATSAGFESRMAAYVGRSEGDLVASLGVPARIYQTEGRRFLQYERRRVVAESAGRWGWAGSYGVETLNCSVTFEIEAGRVDGFTSRGNDCVATPPS